MRVRVELSLDIDQRAWAEEYCISRQAASVRNDVRMMVDQILADWLRERGLGALSDDIPRAANSQQGPQE